MAVSLLCTNCTNIIAARNRRLCSRYGAFTGNTRNLRRLAGDRLAVAVYIVHRHRAVSLYFVFTRRNVLFQPFDDCLAAFGNIRQVDVCSSVLHQLQLFFRCRTAARRESFHVQRFIRQARDLPVDAVYLNRFRVFSRADRDDIIQLDVVIRYVRFFIRRRGYRKVPFIGADRRAVGIYGINRLSVSSRTRCNVYIRTGSHFALGSFYGAFTGNTRNLRRLAGNRLAVAVYIVHRHRAVSLYFVFTRRNVLFQPFDDCLAAFGNIRQVDVCSSVLHQLQLFFRCRTAARRESFHVQRFIRQARDLPVDAVYLNRFRVFSRADRDDIIQLDVVIRYVRFFIRRRGYRKVPFISTDLCAVGRDDIAINMYVISSSIILSAAEFIVYAVNRNAV